MYHWNRKAFFHGWLLLALLPSANLFILIANTAPVERRITPLYVPLAITYRVKGSSSASVAEQRLWY